MYSSSFVSLHFRSNRHSRPIACGPTAEPAPRWHPSKPGSLAPSTSSGIPSYKPCQILDRRLGAAEYSSPRSYRTYPARCAVKYSVCRLCFIFFIGSLWRHQRLLPLVHQAVGCPLEVARRQRRQPVHHAGQNLPEFRRQSRRLNCRRLRLTVHGVLAKEPFCPIHATTRTWA